MELEELVGVRCSYNTDKVSVVEIETNFKKKELILPYTREGDKYSYSVSVKDYCKLHRIEYRKYFNMLHKDCN